MTAAAPKSAAPNSRPLTGQKALVTGANSGIGQAVAIALGEPAPMSWLIMLLAMIVPRR
jgi:hypothetical protein